jgi:hypothetical protein
MLKYAPFQKRTGYGSSTNEMSLVDWSGKIADVDYSTMIQDGIFLREMGEDTYWLENEEFDCDINFLGQGWARNDTVYNVFIPKLGVTASITATRFADIISKVNMINGVMINVKWRFGRRGATTFIEFV